MLSFALPEELNSWFSMVSYSLSGDTLKMDDKGWPFTIVVCSNMLLIVVLP